jgi:hypothetical protein
MTAPATYHVENTRTFDQPFELVWEKLVQFFAIRNIQIKNIAKDSGVIYAEAISFNDDLADCGDRGLWTLFKRTATFNVFVIRSTEHPRVSVTTEFQETRQFQRSMKNVICNSKGNIEKIFSTRSINFVLNQN